MSIVQRAGWEDGDVHKIKEREMNAFQLVLELMLDCGEKKGLPYFL